MWQPFFSDSSLHMAYCHTSWQTHVWHLPWRWRGISLVLTHINTSHKFPQIIFNRISLNRKISKITPLQNTFAIYCILYVEAMMTVSAQQSVVLHHLCMSILFSHIRKEEHDYHYFVPAIIIALDSCCHGVQLFSELGQSVQHCVLELTATLRRLVRDITIT